jgi:fibronectin-binding autotransporter adhesin
MKINVSNPILSALLALPIVVSFSGSALAQAINKDTDGTDLTAGGSWAGDVVPGSGNVATWVTVSLGGALTLGSAQAWQGIDIQGATGTITTSGAGTLTLGSSGINIAGGAVNLETTLNVNVGATQNWTVGSGRTFTTSSGGKTLAINNALTLDGAGIVFIGGTSGSTTLTGTADLNINNGRLAWGTQTGSSIAGYSGQFVLNSGGKLSINTSNTLPALTINGGTIGSFNSTARTESGTLTIGGDFTVGGSESASVVGNISTGNITFSGATNLGGAVRSIDSRLTGGQGVKFSGIISNGGISVNGASSGIVALSNNANTYTGATTVTSGYLAISLGAIANSSSILLAANTRLFVGDNGTTTINDLSGVSTASIRTDFNLNTGNGARTLSVKQSTDGTFAGSFTEGGSRPLALLKTGTAKLALSGTGGYTGGTTLSQGTLVAANGSALGSSGTVTLNDTNTATNSTTLNIDATAGAVTIARPITIANQGSGTATLGSATTSGTNAATFSGTITLAKDVTLNGGSAGDRFSTTGGIAGTGNVTIAGTSRVLFGTATNTYSGTTSINSNGILQLSDGTATATSFIPDGSAVTVNSGAFLKLAKGGNSETIGGLTGAGTVEAISGDDTLIVGSGDATSSFGGALKNNGGTLALTKTGADTLTLTGASHNYSGATTVSAGTLLVNGALGNTPVTVDATGTIGGTGSLGGSLSFGATSVLKVIDFNDPLAVADSITFGSGFGIANLTGIDWDTLNLNTPYPVLATIQTFGTADIANFGVANAASVGSGNRTAFFTNGSLAVVVIPEPATALLGALGLIGMTLRRRRC